MVLAWQVSLEKVLCVSFATFVSQLSDIESSEKQAKANLNFETYFHAGVRGMVQAR